jgi:hypothetical protein
MAPASILTPQHALPYVLCYSFQAIYIILWEYIDPIGRYLRKGRKTRWRWIQGVYLNTNGSPMKRKAAKDMYSWTMEINVLVKRKWHLHLLHWKLKELNDSKTWSGIRLPLIMLIAIYTVQGFLNKWNTADVTQILAVLGTEDNHFRMMST